MADPEFEKPRFGMLGAKSWKNVTKQEFQELQSRFGSDANIAKAFGITAGKVKYKRAKFGMSTIVRDFEYYHNSKGYAVGHKASEETINQLYNGRKYR